jgi:phosphatidylglycerophosphatase A
VFPLLVAATTIAGVWAASRVEPMYGHDSPKIVIDEVAGQMLTLAFASRSDSREVLTAAVLGFLLFRFFDILKPFPIRRLEHLHGGFGVVADDLGAGFYALVVLTLVEPWAVEVMASF